MKTQNDDKQQRDLSVKKWMANVIKPDEITRYLKDGKDFIDDEKIERQIADGAKPDRQKIKDIIAKSLSIERLEPEETAALLNLKDNDLWDEIFAAAGEIKKRVYDNRIVTFAPFYCSNYCVNNCAYCGFRKENSTETRRRLTLDEIRNETKALVSMGHKRLIVVYGEHPSSDADYIAESLKTIYATKVGNGEIRRANVNAAPMSIEQLKMLGEIGLGTYQVFQETYHHKTYQMVHPSGIKADYRWRLYALHRSQDAGVDDVGMGALFGLYDWRFEVMGLLYHAMALEERFGIGPHTISFPRLEPASDTPFIGQTKYKVSDDDFKKIIAILRLSVPYTGLIITARESAKIRKEVLPLGVTQTDASSRIGIGSYSDDYNEQQPARQQFVLGDTRTLDEMIKEFAKMGHITSFCTAGYRCGRTGKCIMDLLKNGKERWFCKLNAVLTFKEYLLDFADEETRKIGQELIEKEIAEIKEELPDVKDKFAEYLERIEKGERDLYF